MLGINPQAVEDAINLNPKPLVLDLSEPRKHTTLSKPPKERDCSSVAQIVGQCSWHKGWRSVVHIRRSDRS